MKVNIPRIRFCFMRSCDLDTSGRRSWWTYAGLMGHADARVSARTYPNFVVMADAGCGSQTLLVQDQLDKSLCVQWGHVVLVFWLDQLPVGAGPARPQL